MSRQEFSRKTRRAIFERAAGKCEACGAALKPGEGEVDHILPASLGGDASVANGRLICRVCHVAKTSADVKGIRKADRQRDKNTPAIRPKQSIRSAGFPRSEREPRVSTALPPRQLYTGASE